MAENRVVFVKQGETKFVMQFTLTDDSGQLLNFTPIGGVDWDLSFIVTKPGSLTPQLIAGALTPIEPFVDNLGKCYYEMTEADVSLKNGDYDLEVTAVQPNGRRHKFPKIKDGVFGTLKMLKSKEVP